MSNSDRVESGAREIRCNTRKQYSPGEKIQTVVSAP